MANAIWSAVKASYSAAGYHQAGMAFHEKGFKAAWKAANPGMGRPYEGLLHNLKRAGQEFTGFDKGMKLGGKTFGGGLFTPGGWREILRDSGGVSRSLGGAMKTGAFKALGPAFFIYQAMTEGIVPATRDAAIWGAASFGLQRLGVGLLNPVTGVAALAAGVAIGGRAALRAGRDYHRQVRKVNFGNAPIDTYGTIATMRQAGLQAIQSSKINGRSALGAEASLLHY